MGKVASRKNAGRLLRVPAFWSLAFVLGAALIVMPLAVGKQKLMLKGDAVAGSRIGFVERELSEAIRSWIPEVSFQAQPSKNLSHFAWLRAPGDFLQPG